MNSHGVLYIHMFIRTAMVISDTRSHRRQVMAHPDPVAHKDSGFRNCTNAVTSAALETYQHINCVRTPSSLSVAGKQSKLFTMIPMILYLDLYVSATWNNTFSILPNVQQSVPYIHSRFLYLSTNHVCYEQYLFSPGRIIEAAFLAPL